jgi:hypothetical protein
MTGWATAAAGLFAAFLALVVGLEPARTWASGAGAAVELAALPGDGGGDGDGGGRVRVVLLDGLSRADAPRLPALEALCARGADLIVDVGFPTRSLPVQEVLWTGLTAQQLGSPYHNEARSAAVASVPARVPGAVAVVEAYRAIAASVGFATVRPDAAADSADAGAVAASVASWRHGGFVDAAVAATASAAPLVLVHVLAIDEAAHRHGRRGPVYDAALAAADRGLAAVAAVAPAGARLISIADHGHIARGGHGDAEDEVRRVRACVAPAPPLPRAAEIHMIDVARLVADDLGIALDPRARGRSLVVAARHPARNATLPHPSTVALVAAAVVVVAGLVVAAHAGGVAALWPALALALWWALRGAPTLSNRISLDLALAAALLPLGLAISTAATPRRLIARSTAPVAATVALAIVCGLPAYALGGAPPRLPGWTGLLAWSAMVAAAALAAGAAAAIVRLQRGRRDRRAGR